MDAARSAAIIHTLFASSSRRGVVAALGGALLAVLPVARVGDALASDSKKHKKRKRKKPKFTTITRLERQSVTRTFANATPIAIPATGTDGNASPYPSAIEVSGFANGVITDVNLTLHGLSHAAPIDVDVLLAPSHLPGKNAVVMSDVGGQIAATNLTLLLDDQAATGLPENGPLTSGTFRPTDRVSVQPTDDWPGQSPSGNSQLGVFNGADPNGSWRLFITDDLFSFAGSFAGGWSLTITALVDVQVQDQVPVRKKKKRKKKH
jgi:hypothetical protein